MDRFIGMFCVAIIAACSGAGGAAPTSRPCPAFVRAPPQLVSPAAGATAVPATVGTVVLKRTASGESLRLVPASGAAVGPIALAPDTAGDATASIPALSAATVYSVTIDGIPGGCGTVSSTIGAFTTQ